MISDERQAIVAYLREVADMWTGPGYGENFSAQDLRDAVNDVVTVCANDVEQLHPDTLPPRLLLDSLNDLVEDVEVDLNAPLNPEDE